ncbi:hypothetical protein Kpol_1010p59 [Vanderwaltozyma polyspora DSM 70294]|uniref:Phosphate system positive regulatory protein PHO81 n=1 Tax=Vanderwaltozyma polyspora (strain ATCC 22028 / DSM 70294 / BCRC 21397 / CBS 2163 / NBRC 10782 / NRRL Y-8283 / UCD 57-17) TaxID=436907 RepID=A7TIK4_VANPO|nr:uncharacterized protein Kpol_1010p59 [Vanderwaltozyma polyspora DSM 70294]EDO17942.1 hypothetical protein Kpol_1010p59 [Vanderwaltozyma polyspora DSM 70294]
MKFGKYLEARQVELPEHNGYFIDYKALKKLIKHLSIPNSNHNTPSFDSNDASNTEMNNTTTTMTMTDDQNTDPHSLDDINQSLVYKRLQENQSAYFFKLERELEKVNSYYLEKELDLHIKFDILKKKLDDYKKHGKLTTKDSVSYKNLLAGIKKLQRDLTNLEQFVELNRTGFMKALKKWDKRSHSHQKEFYFATVISIQPIFTNNDIPKLNDSLLTLSINLEDTNNLNLTEIVDLTDNKNITINNPLIIEHDENKSLKESLSKLTTTLAKVTSEDPTISKTALTGPFSKFSIANELERELLFELEIESEIETWFKELLTIANIKDESRKREMLENFSKLKIDTFINKTPEAIKSNDKNNNIIKDAVTKLFLLLVESDLDDESLKIFFSTTNDRIDLSYYDENDQVFSRRNVIHEAARCATQSRLFVLEEMLKTFSDSKDLLMKLINAQDFHLRTPLHYVSELGKSDFVRALLETKLIESVDILDRDSRTPFILAIVKNHIDIVKLLLEEGKADPAPQNTETSKPQFSPLTVACYHNNYQIAKMILERGSIDLKSTFDHEGLGNLHVVARRGGSSKLIQLLVQHGADPNGFDEFNKWTPIFYAVKEGHKGTVEELLKNGANINITDDENRSPLFYAIWEGHVDVLNVLIKINSDTDPKALPVNSKPLLTGDFSMSPVDSCGDIPDFTLPPPIIPLRKYGHNFLENKVFVKIILRPNSDFIKIHSDDDIVTLPPGRITLTSNLPGSFPRNIILPIENEEDGEIVFQIDSLDEFAVDFETFPSYGTKLIAKTTVMSNVLTKKLSNGCGKLILPMFDSRVTNIGSFIFEYQIVYPCNVKPLEITKYETYWKSTSNDMTIKKDLHQFVTSSSLIGRYASLKVCSLNDGTIVVTPMLYITIGTIKIFMNDLSKNQLESFLSYNIEDVPEINNFEDLIPLLNSKVYSLDKLLTKIDNTIQLDIQLCYPTEQEVNEIPVKMGPLHDLNSFIDKVLLVVFDHVRDLRHSGKDLRSIVFSSSNQQACVSLNWKQPNFAVLYRMGVLYREGDEFVTDTAHHLKSEAVNKKILNLTNHENYYLREIVRDATNNNLFGIILPYELLQVCSQIGSTIRSNGLLLIASLESESENVLHNDDINGTLIGSKLEFHRSIGI